jgi:hypothetical protein
MKLLNFYTSLIEEESVDIMTAEEIADYISGITPDSSDVPDFFIKQVLKSEKTFKLQKISIEDLLASDPSLAEYVESGEERYGDEEENEYQPSPNELDNPIVVFDGEVIDGYSRVATHYQNGEDLIYGYVSQ